MDRELVRLIVPLPYVYEQIEVAMRAYSLHYRTQYGRDVSYHINYIEVINDFLSHLFNAQTESWYVGNLEKGKEHVSDLPYELTLSTLQAHMLNRAYMEEDFVSEVCGLMATMLAELALTLNQKFHEIAFDTKGGFADYSGFNLRAVLLDNGEVVFDENPPGYSDTFYSFRDWVEVVEGGLAFPVFNRVHFNRTKY